MSRFRTALLTVLSAGVLCMSGCVAAQKNQYREHLDASVSQSPSDDEAIMLFVGGHPAQNTFAVVEAGQPR